MSRAKCFRCGEWFDSNSEDDLAGDGKCFRCKEWALKIALVLDEQRKGIDPNKGLATEDPSKKEFLTGPNEVFHMRPGQLPIKGGGL